MISEIKAKAQTWLTKSFDEKTRNSVKDLIENNEEELIESFYKNLEFGTGGLRGIMGVGTNRMNIYTVGLATQGLCNYVKKNFSQESQIKIAIAYDCRNNSQLFAETVANIFSANGVKVYLFESLRPTPELSFAIRHFGCQSGVVITASHNPKEYNGFKAYWDDGAQLIAPHDTNVIDEVNKIQDISDVKFEGDKSLIEVIGSEIDKIYIDKIKELSLSEDIIKKNKNLKIVYTPIHGTGVNLVPDTLKAFGFENVISIKEQNIVDGNFPTVISPNPEETDALKMALDKAKEIDADIVMATDPDADRVGIAVKNQNGEFKILNGNQTGAILTEYMLSKWKENNKLTGKEYIVKTIVTTELIADIAENYKVEKYDVLTGFKYIADIIKKNEGNKTFITGGEESYGYLAGEFVRDKDAVMACALIAELAAVANDKNKTLFDTLIDIYLKYGFYKESLKSIVRKGKSGAEEIQKIMSDFRENTPEKINNSKIIKVNDYLTQISLDTADNTTTKIDLPKSNVLQFFTEDGSKISIRPSGTEPKIKFYFSVKSTLDSKENFDKVNNELDSKINNIIEDLGL